MELKKFRRKLNTWISDLKNSLYGMLYVNRIIEHIKIALAGVGKPKYFSESLISFNALYLASLMDPRINGKELNQCGMCNFVGKTEGGLKTHKTKKHKEKQDTA